MADIDQWKATHAALGAQLTELLMLARALTGASSDTYFALGEAAGVISKAKGLLGRDIDDATRR